MLNDRDLANLTCGDEVIIDNRTCNGEPSYPHIRITSIDHVAKSARGYRLDGEADGEESLFGLNLIVAIIL